MPGKMYFDNSSCLLSDLGSFCNVLKRANVPLDEKWPATIIQLRAVDQDITIGADQKADLQQLLVKTLKEKDFSDEAFRHLRRNMSKIYLAPLDKQIKEITLEVNGITREVGKMMGLHTKQVMSVASTIDKGLSEEEEPSDVLSILRVTLVELITRMEQDSALFKYLATKDSLTGLDNRRSFDSYLATSVELFSTKKEALGLLIFDVDHFKQFNDNYGHLVGDQVLKHIAAITKKCVQDMGEENKDWMVSRFGGDEFAIALRGSITNNIEVIAKNLCQGVAHSSLLIKDAQDNIVQNNLSVTVSIGGTKLYKAWKDNYVANLISFSDKALYEAKSNGRNRVAFFNPITNMTNIICEG